MKIHYIWLLLIASIFQPCIATENSWIRIDVFQFLNKNTQVPAVVLSEKLPNIPLKPIELSEHSTSSSDSSELFQQLERDPELEESLQALNTNTDMTFIRHDAWYQPVARQPISILMTNDQEKHQINTYLTIQNISEQLHSTTFIVNLTDLADKSKTTLNSAENRQLIQQSHRIIGENELHHFQLGDFTLLISITPYI